MKKLLANLSVAQQITMIVVATAVAAGLYGFVHWQKEDDFKPLFTGLAPEEAGGIVQKLKESGADYRLRDSGSEVLVPSAHLAELRLSMALAGLPKTGRMGFELFDKTNLGASEFTEHVNYRRALEGELERSIMSLAEVEQARVHITFPKDSVFQDAQQPAKASVLVKIRPNARISPQNVQAVNHLVASAVEGLSPDAVSVLDMNGNLLGRPKASGGLDGPEASEAVLDYRHRIEADLVAKVSATLEPLLGAEKFRVGASVECDFTGAELSEETYDPAHSVMLTSQRSDDDAGVGTTSGVPGTASTLPRPASRPATGNNRSTRVTENITFQNSRVVKKTHQPAGTVQKISLAVLVDQDVTWQKDKSGYQRVLVPPSPEKLKVIHDLVAGVAGLNEHRGDQMVVETLPFETTLLLEPPDAPPPAAPGAPAKPAPNAHPGIQLDRKTMLIEGGAVGGLLLLGVAILLLRRRGRSRGHVTVAAALPAAEGTVAVAEPSGPGIEQQIESKLAERDALQQKMEAQALNSLKLTPVITKTAEVMAKHLREKIKAEPELSAQALRTWIREEES